MSLSEDELEALYLADFKGLYQEDCARELGVSRPTFAKIIKSARKKTAEMLMYAKGIELVKQKQNFVLVFPTDDRITVHPYFITAKFFAFAKIEEDAIASISYTPNPIYEELEAKGVVIENDDSAKGMAAGRIIPPLLKKAQVLVVHSLGDGMRRNIEGMGLNIEYTAERNIDTVLEQLLK
jgi:predicted Fe-Mo cluster-binding NifX family protein